MSSEPPVFTLVTGQKPPQDTQQLADEITRLAGHINAANYRFLSLVAEFDRLGGWSGAGIKSCAHWLAWQCGLEMGAAREKVRVARRLEQLPLINAAFAAGEISYSTVRALTRDATEATEDYYLYIAEHGTASQVEQLIRKHRRVKKLQSNSQAELQEDARCANYYMDDDGMWVIKAKLPPAEGELLIKALDAIMEGEADELTDAAISPEEYDDASKPRKTFPRKRADALSTMAEHFLATAENGIADLKGSERCQVILHVDLETLQKQANHKHCRLDQDNWLHPNTAKRLSCDASLVTVLEDGAGKVLNIGRRSRIVPPSIKRALDVRDGQCRFPGCSCKRYVDAHHIQHWVDGGDTSLDNLVTLCRFHHRALHQGEFTVARTSNTEEFVFTDRRGGRILPSFRPQFPHQENVPAGTFFENGQIAKILEVERFNPEITPQTCKTRWIGEEMDYDIAVQALLRREELAPGPGDSP
jgi:hypothetical protein